MVTGKPRHSESNGGVERRNCTVENKISNWMHENQSTHWAQALPFIQWRCNTQIHRGIGERTPYHLMFGQHPQVGISNLPIDKSLLKDLATEMDVCRTLGLPDIPLESVNLANSLGADDIFENPLSAHTEKGNEASITAKQSTGPSILVKKKQDLQSGGKMDETPMMWMNNKLVPFHSDGFRTDVTERIIKQLLDKAVVHTKGGYSYFGWKGVGFQCGVCFSSLPKIDLSFASRFLSLVPSMNPKLPLSLGQGQPPTDTVESHQHMRKSPPELLFTNQSVTVSKSQVDIDDGDDNKLFSKSHLLVPSKYEENCTHRWLFLLLKCYTTPNPTILQNAPLRTCFAVVDKENLLTDPWRRVLIRKVQKETWEVLD